ncbi:MAG: ComF family protein, partial [Elusimicrobia bacterium]|nr:ComF family protein [Elusimicrobiota bacterium]
MHAARMKGLLLDLLWPQTCAHCRRDLPRGWDQPLCAACLPRLRPVDRPWCARCGVPHPGAGLCASCRASASACRMIRAASLYREASVSLIHAFKYRGRKSAALWAGGCMARAWTRFPELGRPDALVPVPLHRRRLAERGYNQAELLAESLGRGLGIPLMRRGLARLKNTKPQWTLGRKKRLENLAGAFAADASLFRGLRVLLVDDVCTTGASLEECARALRRAGAQGVSAYAFA